MATLVFALPIIPGKEEIDRDNIRRTATPGPEHDAFVAARRAAGITREAVWHSRHPTGPWPSCSSRQTTSNEPSARWRASDDPFAQAFREQTKEVHGFDLATDPPPSVELISDASF